MDNNWFPYEIDNKKYKLICFNHAGGNSTIFKDWINWDEEVDVIPVEIPGRRRRIREECRTDFKGLVEDVSREIDRLRVKGILDREGGIYIYGHSLGGALGFEVGKVLMDKYHFLVKALFIAGRHAPQDEDPTPYRTVMGIDKLKEELRRSGNTPEELLENDSFMSIFLPMIFADYQLHEDYKYDGRVIDCEIYTLSGSNDAEADINHMKNWETVTCKPLIQKEFIGGHFFAYEESSTEVKDFILNVIKGEK